ncbi:hypothetical protein BZY94_09520 [Burkholderia territorii]|nr:hypothetical protein BZY94_09520 [Burkholderia territorii]
MHRVADVLTENSKYLAAWVTREQSKPLGGVGPGQVPGSRFEVWACEAWARVTRNLDLPVEVVFEDESRRDEVHRKPFGVVAAIAPGGFNRSMQQLDEILSTLIDLFDPTWRTGSMQRSSIAASDLSKRTQTSSRLSSTFAWPCAALDVLCRRAFGAWRTCHRWNPCDRCA